jgi:glycine/D-amino acid oxidase-like deaminating enzyme
MPDLEGFDFICVGGGIGGLAAAIAAHDAGLRTLVVEKSPFLGGVAAYSAGTCWVPANHCMPDDGVDDSLEEAAAYLAFIGGSDATADLVLRNAILGAAPEVFASLASEIPFQISGSPDQYWSWAAGSKGRGRILETTCSGIALGPWRRSLRENPYFPSGLSAREVRDSGKSPTNARIEMADLIAERARADFLTGGSGLLAAFIASALVRRSVTCLLDTPVVGLVTQGGRVTGVRIEHNGEEAVVESRNGVLIATGGYGYAEFAPALEGLPTFRELSPPIVHGDGMIVASEVGAAVVRAGNGFYSAGIASATRVHPGTDEPLYLGFLLPMSYPHSIVVNREGERFADESVFGAFSSELPAIDGKHKRHRNVPCFFICDDQYRKAGFRINGANDGWPTEEFVRAESLDDLADALGIDREGLLATVERYNGFESSGVDEDFGRGTSEFTRRPQANAGEPLANPLIGALREPPFWGGRLEPLGSGVCSHGLRVDSGARVLDWAGEPIGGLYATGNAVAYTEIPFGYQDGYANSRNVVLGTLAARSAAQR